MNKEFHVTVRFDQTVTGTVKVYAPTVEEAKDQVLKMAQEHKNPEVLNVYEVPTNE